MNSTLSCLGANTGVAYTIRVAGALSVEYAVGVAGARVAPISICPLLLHWCHLCCAVACTIRVAGVLNPPNACARGWFCGGGAHIV